MFTAKYNKVKHLQKNLPRSSVFSKISHDQVFTVKPNTVTLFTAYSTKVKHLSKTYQYQTCTENSSQIKHLLHKMSQGQVLIVKWPNAIVLLNMLKVKPILNADHEFSSLIQSFGVNLAFKVSPQLKTIWGVTVGLELKVCSEFKVGPELQVGSELKVGSGLKVHAEIKVGSEFKVGSGYKVFSHMPWITQTKQQRINTKTKALKFDIKGRGGRWARPGQRGREPKLTTVWTHSIFNSELILKHTTSMYKQQFCVLLDRHHIHLEKKSV